MNNPKNSKAKINANDRYNKNHYENISIRVKPEEADYIRKVAKDKEISIAQLILQSVKMYDSIDSVATPDDIKTIKEGEKELRNGETISHNDIDWN